MSVRRRFGRPSTVGILLSAVAVLAAGCSIGPSNRPPLATYGERPEPTGSETASAPAIGPGGQGQQADPLDWGRCAEVNPTSADGTTFDVECAELEVPLSYSAGASGAGSPDLELPVARALAADTPQDAPNLVVVLDRPGSNGVQAVADVAASLPAEVLAGHAIVTLDLRGTGGEWSDGLSCFEPRTVQDLLSPPADPTTSSGSELLAETAKGVYFNCNDQIGPSITEYGSIAAADDLDSLRSALGTEQLQFLGRGDGATLGAIYAHRYPARVQRMVLDGPFDPQAAPTEEAATRAVALDAALDEFAADCVAGGDCPLGEDPKGAVTRLVADLGDAGEAAGRWLFSGGSVLLMLTDLLGRPDTWDALATALAAAADGDAQRAAILLRRSVTGAVSPGGSTDPGDDLRTSDLGLEPQIAFACNDTDERLDGAAVTAAAEAAAEKAPVFGPFLAGRAGLCGAWPAAVSPVPRLSGEGAAPILVIGAVDDPIAPYASVKSVTNQLASARLLSWQSSTHGAVTGSSCVASAVAGYLSEGTLPDNGRLCPP